MLIRRIEPELVPLDLLLVADPSERHIQRYLHSSECYVAEEMGTIVAACLVKQIDGQTAELMNIAVDTNNRQQGIGTALLHHVIDVLRNGACTKLRLGTGAFGHQLAFYQRAGFRVIAVEQDYFINTYPEPLFELGIQHRDRLILELELKTEIKRQH